jgi:hypothetical protein
MRVLTSGRLLGRGERFELNIVSTLEFSLKGDDDMNNNEELEKGREQQTDLTNLVSCLLL